MTEQYLVGTDVGTYATKTVVVTPSGEVVGSAKEEYDVLQRRPCWAEQLPEPWEKATYKSIREGIKDANADPSRIRGLTVSALYGGSGIPVNEDFEPIYPCLIWMDRRATEQVEWVKENVDLEELFEITGNYVDTYYGYTKMLWIKDNEPLIWDKIHKFVPPASYVEYKMTGELAVDYSSAGNIGGVFDINDLEWSEDACEQLGISIDKMPSQLVESGEVVGEVSPEVSRKCCLEEGTPVIAGGIDAAAATLGAGAFERGNNVAMMGTSTCWGTIHSGESFSKRLVSMPHVADSTEKVYTFGGSATSGALINWFKEQFGRPEEEAGEKIGIRPFELLDRKAEEIPPGSDGLITLPYFKGERSPIWDPNARGAILGFTLFHTKSHIFRALMEAGAYSLRHNMEVGEEIGLPLEDECRVVGGVSNSKLWTEIIAHVTGRDVAIPAGGVGAPLADAFLAGIGTGLFDGYDRIEEWVCCDRVETPDPEKKEIYDEYYELYKRLYRDTKGIMHKLSKL